MTWRPTEWLIDGKLDNTKRGIVTGWMRFVGLPEKVTFDLKGDFHRDIRGTRVRLNGAAKADGLEAKRYMVSFRQACVG